MAVCHAFVEQLRNGTAPWVVQRLNNTFGPMPTDTSNFTFWMAQVSSQSAKVLRATNDEADWRPNPAIASGSGCLVSLPQGPTYRRA